MLGQNGIIALWLTKPDGAVEGVIVAADQDGVWKPIKPVSDTADRALAFLGLGGAKAEASDEHYPYRCGDDTWCPQRDCDCPCHEIAGG